MTKTHEKIRLENMAEYGFGTEAMKKIKVCKCCGAKMDSELLFCTECQMPLPSKTLFMIYVYNHFVCTQCKTVISSEYKFCPQCGKQLIFDKKSE